MLRHITPAIGAGIEVVDQARHVGIEVAGLDQPFEEAGDRHVVEREEAVEGDAEVALQRRLPFVLDARLRRGQERAGGIGHQRQDAARIALAVADGVEQRSAAIDFSNAPSPRCASVLRWR